MIARLPIAVFMYAFADVVLLQLLKLCIPNQWVDATTMEYIVESVMHHETMNLGPAKSAIFVDDP